VRNSFPHLESPVPFRSNVWNPRFSKRGELNERLTGIVIPVTRDQQDFVKMKAIRGALKEKTAITQYTTLITIIRLTISKGQASK
jgi:hypothetical protein